MAHTFVALQCHILTVATLSEGLHILRMGAFGEDGVQRWVAGIAGGDDGQGVGRAQRAGGEHAKVAGRPQTPAVVVAKSAAGHSDLVGTKSLATHAAPSTNISPII